MATPSRPNPSLSIPPTPGSSTSTRGAALILVPEDDREAQGEVEVDEVLGYWPDPSIGDDRQLGSPRPRSGVPLPPHILIFLLIAPSLRLGATFIPQSVERSGIPFVLATLGFFCLLGWFSSHVWIMMGRYVRKWSIEEVTAEALVGDGARRGGRRKRWRRRVTASSKWGIVTTASLLCSVYFIEAVNRLPRAHLETLNADFTRTLCTGIVGLLLSPLLTTQSLGSKRVVGFNLLCVVTHLVVIGLVVHAYLHPEANTPPKGDQWMPDFVIDPSMWQTISGISFIPTSHIFTYQSYASHAARPISLANGSPPRKRPFASLLGFSSIVSFLILGPLVLTNLPPSLPIQLLQSLILLSGIPTLWVYSIAPRLPSARYQPPLYLVIVLISAFPSPALHNFIRTLSIISMLGLSYLIPAILHVTFHSFRAPLSILLPEDDATSPSSSGSDSDEGGTEADELLRRKERTLQRRRLGKRLGWDLGVWCVLGPIGFAVCVWNIGNLFKRW